jgi:hypothetical protein
MTKRIITLEDIEIDGEVVPKDTVCEYESKTPIGYFIRTKTKNVTLLKKSQAKEFAEADLIADNVVIGQRVVMDDVVDPSRTDGSKDGSNTAASGATFVFNGPITFQMPPSSDEIKEYFALLVKEIFKSTGVSEKSINQKKESH